MFLQAEEYFSRCANWSRCLKLTCPISGGFVTTPPASNVWRLILFCSLSDAGAQLSILPAPVPRGGGCSDGEREVHRRDGRLCQPFGVQQHRGHDPPERAVTSTYPLHQQAHPHRSQWMRGRHPSGQREGWVQAGGYWPLELEVSESQRCTKDRKHLLLVAKWQE